MAAPRAINTFHSYMDLTDNFLRAISATPDSSGNAWTNGARLGWSAAEMTDWHNMRLQADDDFNAVSNNPHKDSVKVSNYETLRFITLPLYWANKHLLSRMKGNLNTTDEDAKIFHFVRVSKKKSSTKVAIKEQCMAREVAILGGGDIEFGCATDHNASRNKKAAGATGVWIYYQESKKGEPLPLSHDPIIAARLAADAARAVNPNPTTPLPVAPIMQKQYFSTSKFILHLGSEHSGEELRYFLQWGVSSNANLNGPISPNPGITGI
ncbi:MAG TPA: hypothetical protein VF411_15760 [Bacteroidia bacterium]